MSDSEQQDFDRGEIGCAFYEFGPKGRSGFPQVWENSLTDVIIATSVDDGQTFSSRRTVTDYAWDATVGAPL